MWNVYGLEKNNKIEGKRNCAVVLESYGAVFSCVFICFKKYVLTIYGTGNIMMISN